MSEVPLPTPGAMLLECNQARVLEAFRRGEFDYVDAATGSTMTAAIWFVCRAKSFPRSESAWAESPVNPV